MALSTRSTPGSGAALGRWDPFREIEEAWSRMGSLLGDVAGGSGRPLGVLAGAALPVDIEETDDAYVVELELPGVRREDVSIDLRDNELHVSGEIRERERTGVVRRQSRRVGRFEHRITLPGEVDTEGVSASLADGVLTVSLPKARRSQQRHIEITAGDRDEAGTSAQRSAEFPGGGTSTAGGRAGQGGLTTGDSGVDRGQAGGRQAGSADRDTGSAQRETGPAGRQTESTGRQTESTGRQTGSTGRQTESTGREAGSAGRETGFAGREAGSPGREAGPGGREFR
ncbi:Hsp20/alpha crystallin family protein [Frankia sp. QA3]|uniref:Hsp20/alpha crystallin family protein n=1 Tax=Frankia sp. QA3 TaxID=710111 RepID=UPI000269C459|nr:Hsp20/alpha crystallin family protein [Frankia sp. QA3]EIV93443.1 molecular chaperone (small heat shock protein) [Frankia sp. QA3]